MNEPELVGMYPRLYHMAQLGSWESIKRHGLLSTTALLDLFGVRGQERKAIEDQRRPDKVPIAHESFGSAVIRDNKPMSDLLLERCLVKMGKVDWYRLLNGHVFFWLTRRSLETFMCARSYRPEGHTIVTVSTSLLLARQRDRIRLSPINSGAIYPGRPVERGPETFSTVADYDIKKYAYRRRDERVRELAVVYSVPDVEDLVTSVEDMRCPRAS